MRSISWKADEKSFFLAPTEDVHLLIAKAVSCSCTRIWVISQCIGSLTLWWLCTGMARLNLFSVYSSAIYDLNRFVTSEYSQAAVQEVNLESCQSRTHPYWHQEFYHISQEGSLVRTTQTSMLVDAMISTRMDRKLPSAILHSPCVNSPKLPIRIRIHIPFGHRNRIVGINKPVDVRS